MKSGDRLQLFDGNGAAGSLQLKDQLNVTSGEADLWLTDSGEIIAKIYKYPGKSPAQIEAANKLRAEKLSVMVAHPPTDPAAAGGFSIAWPKYLLKKGGKTVGFGMPKVPDAKRSTILCMPHLRMKDIPTMDWFWIHHAALRIARVCHAVHEMNYVIGDFKSDNWLIDSSMSAYVVDTDSFQVQDPGTGRIFRSPVGTAEYTPTELFNQDFAKIDRDVSSDNFALAVLIYQLLAGQHPFSGGINQKRNDETLINAVARIPVGQWLNGRSSFFRPTKNDITLDTFSPALAQLFKRCFDDGHNAPAKRPRPAEWISALEETIAGLSWCSANKGHVYSSASRQCPWCEFTKRNKIDLWVPPNGGKSQSFDFSIKLLKQHFQRGDYPYVLRALEANTSFRSEPRLSSLVKSENAIRPVVQQYDKIEAALRGANPDSGAISDKVNQDPRLLKIIKCYPDVWEKYQDVVAFAQAKEKLDQAIAAAEPQSGKKFTLDGEKHVLKVFSEHEDIFKRSQTLGKSHAPRVGDANKRVKAFEAIRAALNAHDEQKTAQLMQSSSALLASLEEFTPLEQDARLIATAIEALNRFISAASQRQTRDSELVKLWESAEQLEKTRTSRKPVDRLGGKSPFELYQLVSVRYAETIKLRQTFGDLDSQAGPLIQEVTETEILTAADSAKQKIGNEGGPLDDDIVKRVTTAQERLKTFALLKELYSKPESQDYSVAVELLKMADLKRFQIPNVAQDRFVKALEYQDKAKQFAAAALIEGADEQALLKLVDAYPKLESSAASPSTPVGGSTLHLRIRQARQRVAALHEIDAAISQADNFAAKTRPGEQCICEVRERHLGVLRDWPGLPLELRVRMDQAAQRLARGKALEAAAAEGDEIKMLTAWGNDTLLDDYEPAQTFRDVVDEAAAIAARFTDVENHVHTHPFDDVGIVARADQLGDLLQKPYCHVANKALGGRVLSQVLDLSRRRMVFVDSLEHLGTELNSKQLLDLYAGWDEAFDVNHPKIAPKREAIARGKTIREALDDLLAALKKSDPKVITQAWRMVNWSGLQLSDLTEDAKCQTDLKVALRQYLRSGKPLDNAVLTQVSDMSFALTWDWKDPFVTHAMVLVGDKRMPASSREAIATYHTTYDDFRQTKSVHGDFKGEYLALRVVPAMVFADTQILPEYNVGLRVREPTRRSLQYKFRKGLISGPSLTLSTDRPIRLPELVLVRGNEVIKEWGEVDMDQEKELSISLGRGFNTKDCAIVLRRQADAEWLKLEAAS